MTATGENLTPGEMLLAAREKASLTLEQVAENTKIPLNMLRAIELDEYHKVSGDLYVKSFLRSYGTEVELDPEELISMYLAFTGASTPEGENAVAGSWDESDVQVKKVGLAWGSIVLVVVIVVVVAGLVFWFTRSTDETNDAADIIQPSQERLADTPEQPSPAVEVVADTSGVVSTANDTLALGWQMSRAESTPELQEPVAEVDPGPPPGTGQAHLPRAFPADANVIFQDGKQWPYVLRLISPRAGRFSLKKDAESAYQPAEFTSSLSEAKPLPADNLVAGRAYACRQGFVVYWGADDHVSLRLGHVQGVELSFNGHPQDLSRFRDGEEILLDSSALENNSGD